MNKVKSKKYILIPVCLVLIIGILCAVIVTCLPEKEVVQYNYSSGKQSKVEFDKGFKPFVLAGESILYVNEGNSAVAITNESGEVIFNSHSESAAENKLAYILSAVFRDKRGNAYLVNSSVNSVAENKFKVTTEKKNDVTITFELVDDKGEAIAESFPVKFYEENGGIKVEIDTRNVVLKDGFCIEKISVLPGLFSENNPQSECFYTVPDGCGAQIDLTQVSKKDYSKTLDVYGSDITFSEYSQGATLPCFSMTKGKAMLTAIIEDGDALSSVYVSHNKKIGGNLYNSFVVTPYGRINGRLVKGSSYEGKLSQVYYFTSSGTKNYNTVSALLRDNLIRRGYLPSKMSDAFVDYPFFVTAIGSENGKKNNVYTSFENASEIIALLKTRGVRSIALRFAGAGDNGLNSGAKSSNKLSGVLGGEKAYNKLCKVASDNNSSTWLDIDLALNPSVNGKNNTDVYKAFREYLSKPSINSDVAGYNSAYSNVSKNYKTVSELESANVCINDLSQILYTDVVGNVTRQEALNELSGKIQAFGVNGNIMLANPAVYLMNQADAVFSVGQGATLDEYAGVTVVPLLQMVLHGSVCYGSEPINLFEDGQDAVLKAVEYGACPSFVFTYDNCNVLDYGVYATQTAKFYSSAKKMLPLMDMKITSHERVLSGVYKITYDYSKVVYVNYNPSVVEVNGILVSARDFVVI